MDLDYGYWKFAEIKFMDIQGLFLDLEPLFFIALIKIIVLL